MNALSPILPHATLTQVQLYALRDQIDALIDKDRVAYAAGMKNVLQSLGVAEPAPQPKEPEQ